MRVIPALRTVTTKFEWSGLFLAGVNAWGCELAGVAIDIFYYTKRAFWDTHGMSDICKFAIWKWGCI